VVPKVRLIDSYRRWQQRRRARRSADYEHLSDAERAEIEWLREEHSPLGQLGRSQTPPQMRDSDR
jgi:hypothetical protein